MQINKHPDYIYALLNVWSVQMESRAAACQNECAQLFVKILQPLSRTGRFFSCSPYSFEIMSGRENRCGWLSNHQCNRFNFTRLVRIHLISRPVQQVIQSKAMGFRNQIHRWNQPSDQYHCSTGLCGATLFILSDLTNTITHKADTLQYNPWDF